MSALPDRFPPLVALTLVLCGTGCQPATEAVPSDFAAPTFSEKSGLFLPDATRRSLDLQLADITEQKLQSTVSLSLCVYQITARAIMAAGVMPAGEAHRLQRGQAVEARLADGSTLRGHVRAIRAEMRPATGSEELLVEFIGNTSELGVGDFLSATARTAMETCVVTIPRQALLENSEGQFAYTVSGEHFVRTAIKTGARTADFVEVTDGLYAGDQVVRHPVLSLWLTELAAVKGGQACCVTPPRGK